MAWNPLTAANVAANAFWTTTVAQKIKDCLEWLYVSLSGSSDAARNLDFETDGNSDGVPDNWNKTLYAGGAFALNTTTPGSGATGIKFTHPGGASNGGGSLETDYYIEVSEKLSYFLAWLHWASAAGMKNKVQIRYFTKAQIEVGSAVDLYNSVANPASETAFVAVFTPPATARYIKIKLIGGFTDTDVAGIAYFDGLAFGTVTAEVGSTEDAPTAREQSGEAYTKVKEITCPYSPCSVSFTMKRGTEAGYTAVGRVYVNGAASGTERTNATETDTTWTETIANKPGDAIQLYAHSQNPLGSAIVSAFTVAPAPITSWTPTVVTD